MKKGLFLLSLIAFSLLSLAAKGQVTVKVYSDEQDAIVSVSYYPSSGLGIITEPTQGSVFYPVIQETDCCYNGSYSFFHPLLLGFDMMKIQVESNGVMLEKRYNLTRLIYPYLTVFDFTTCF
jgi:hypothetical protein